MRDCMEEKHFKTSIYMTSISTFFFSFCADRLPEKAVQILAEAREHSRKSLHHGKHGGAAWTEQLVQSRCLGKQTLAVGN